MTIQSSSAPTIKAEPLFSTNYSIYINHTDAGGIVYHANHLVFFENCRRDWFTKLNINGYFLQTDEGHIQHFVVSQAQLQYHKAILLDETIEVRIDKVELKPASIIFYQSIHRQQSFPTQHSKENGLNNLQASSDTLLSSTKIVIACVQNQLNPTASKSSEPAATLTDSPLSGQSAAQTNQMTPIKPVRVPKSLRDTIEQAINQHNQPS
ncbi:hotdog domain-containing protein [Psychrobacter sp. 1U2]|uniref:hotdog domain-containing protein n=1 Tax=Psychrobacter sp. 1U2 TaxID=3453577 RepID=UPI003F482A67